jgi:DNA-binding MarR family transcriptional regulator
MRQLDEAVRGMKRLTSHPPEMAITLPGSHRRVDFSRLIACSAIAGMCSTAPAGEPVTVKTLSQNLGLEHSTVSRMLSEAEADGLITRAPHPTDRRSTALSLTPQGEAVVDGFAQARLSFISKLLEDWSVEDVDQLAELLARLVSTANGKRDSWHRWQHDSVDQAFPTANPSESAPAMSDPTASTS